MEFLRNIKLNIYIVANFSFSLSHFCRIHRSSSLGSRFNVISETGEKTDSKFVSLRERKTSLKAYLSLVPVSSLAADKFTLIGRSRFHDA